MRIGNRFANTLGAVDMRGEYNIVDGIMESELIIELLKLADYRTGVVGKWHLGTISQDDRFHHSIMDLTISLVLKHLTMIGQLHSMKTMTRCLMTLV